jgi:hypothetical protein
MDQGMGNKLSSNCLKPITYFASAKRQWAILLHENQQEDPFN